MQRSKLTRLGAAIAGSLVLAAACTANEATRVLNPYLPTDAGAPASGAGARPTGGPSRGGASSGGSATGGTDAGPGPDLCLEQCADPDACTAEEQILVDICRLYAKDCPDQPPDVMMERQRGISIPAGPEATSTATRPQLTGAEADELYSIEEAL